MSLAQFPVGAGVFKDDTPLKAEGYAVDSHWMRVRRQLWETMGGFERATAQSFAGIARGAHTWADLSSTRVLGFGTAASLFAYYSGAISNITPLKAKGTLVNAFFTESGSPRVLVQLFAHGLKNGDTITLSASDAVGGLTLSGAYTVLVATFDAFWITAASNATSTVSNGGGGKVEFSVPLETGLVDGIGGVGYGTGLYGTGLYGVTTTGDINPRVWAADNWGNNGLFCPDNGALYEWQPQALYPELVANGDFAASTGWVLETGWTIGSGHATATAGTASDLELDLTGIISGGVTYDISFDLTVTAGSLQFRVESDADPVSPVDIAFGESIEKGGSYNRRFTAPANPSLIKFSKNSTFAGTLDNVSLKVVSTAYRLQDAPQYSRGMFVDPNRIVVLLGTVQFNGQFNGMCVRWSDQENNRQWAPNSDNLSGEYVLARGSEIRGGLATRNQNLIWTDEAMYTMSFSGSSSDVFSFNLVGTGAGLIAKNAAAEFNGVAFWWGADNNFYIYQGGAPQVIECPIQRDVSTHLATNQQAKISCGINSQFGEVWWLYPDSRDGIECSRAVVYNWDANCWYTCILPRSQWVDSGVFGSPIAFGLEGAIYFHDKGRDANGDALAWHLTTGFYDLGDGDTHFNVTRFVPDFADQQGAVTLSIAFRQFPNSSVPPQKFYTMAAATEKVDFRQSGRQMQLGFSGESAPAFARFGSFRLDMTPSGAKR